MKIEPFGKVLALFLFMGHGVYAETQSCFFGLDKNSTKVGWTAFKTTEKLAVKGSFKKTEIKGRAEADSIAALLEGLEVSVEKLSVDTTNPARDKTLTNSFFRKLDKSISAKVTTVSEKDSSLMVSLDLNDHKKVIPARYEIKDGRSFSATATIDLMDFGGQKALASLHDQCAALHTGKDGVSKTWSEVTLSLTATITRQCK